MILRVLVMRHGQAAAATFAPDDYRHLTVTGRRESEASAHAMTQGGWTPTHIYSSPLVRAVQTAERVASVIDYAGVIESDPALSPGGGAAFVEKLGEHGAGDVVLLVTHEPTVRTLSGDLLGAPAPHFGTAEVRGFELGETAKLAFRFTGA